MVHAVLVPADSLRSAGNLQSHRTLLNISWTKFPAAMPTIDHTVERYSPPEGAQGQAKGFSRGDA